MSDSASRACPYCREAVHPEATACPHCQRDIGPGHTLKTAGQAMQGCGCALTLLVTVPIVLMLLAAAC